ncbi:Ankyrin repeat domain-containing protein, partial [Intoshia linei]
MDLENELENPKKIYHIPSYSIENFNFKYYQSQFWKGCMEYNINVIIDVVSSCDSFWLPKVVNSMDNSGTTVLGHACINGSILLIDVLLNVKCINANCSDNEGNTPLMYAAQAGYLNVIKKILNSKLVIKIDQCNNFGFTALMKAAIQGRNECAKIFLCNGSCAYKRDYGRRFNAEEWAEYCGWKSCSREIKMYRRSMPYICIRSLRCIKEKKDAIKMKWQKPKKIETISIDLLNSPNILNYKLEKRNFNNTIKRNLKQSKTAARNETENLFSQPILKNTVKDEQELNKICRKVNEKIYLKKKKRDCKYWLLFFNCFKIEVNESVKTFNKNADSSIKDIVKEIPISFNQNSASELSTKTKNQCELDKPNPMLKKNTDSQRVDVSTTIKKCVFSCTKCNEESLPFNYSFGVSKNCLDNLRSKTNSDFIKSANTIAQLITAGKQSKDYKDSLNKNNYFFIQKWFSVDYLYKSPPKTRRSCASLPNLSFSIFKESKLYFDKINFENNNFTFKLKKNEKYLKYASDGQVFKLLNTFDGKFNFFMDHDYGSGETCRVVYHHLYQKSLKNNFVNNYISFRNQSELKIRGIEKYGFNKNSAINKLYNTSLLKSKLNIKDEKNIFLRVQSNFRYSCSEYYNVTRHSKHN